MSKLVNEDGEVSGTRMFLVFMGLLFLPLAFPMLLLAIITYVFTTRDRSN